MKKIISMVFAVVLLASLLPSSLAEYGTEYIPAPYTIKDTTVGPTEYLAPVFYLNENGPTIGVTLVGTIKADGKYFKDSNNNQELDVFEDWRLDTATRVADLLPKMTFDQRVGLAEVEMRSSPLSTNVADVMDADGNVDLSKLIILTEGDVYSYGNLETNSTGMMLGNESRTGVQRNTTDAETGALWNNSLAMVTEYAAVAKNEPTIPYTVISNPQNSGIAASGGIAAAAMGDGDYDLVLKYAQLDGQIWDAKGIDGMYGPQIDLITDPRWSRNSGTYTEVPEVMAGIAEALVIGYQNGRDGTQDGDVSLIMKHFPGDGAAENGFESHNSVGEWRIYATKGSLEKHLMGFQAAIDAGLHGIMPSFSRPTLDARSAPQYYRGVEIKAAELANAFNPDIIKTLLYDIMGFTGYINTDSGAVERANYGLEDATDIERFAAMVNAGSDTGANWPDTDSSQYDIMREVFASDLITKEAFDRATTNRMTSVMEMGRFENPYRDPAESKATVDAATEQFDALKAEINRKSVVLMKNHKGALPMTDTSMKVYVSYFGVPDRSGNTPEASLKAEFEGRGFTLVDDYNDADIAFLNVVPSGVGRTILNVLDLVDGIEVEERNAPNSKEKTGKMIELTTLPDVANIPGIAEAVHANGGIVVASIQLSSPWILTNLEPYVDALIGEFSTPITAQMDVLTGAFNPTGKLPITMVSCNEVIAVNDVEIDGEVYEICVSPNDIPGYEKDQYISAEVLAQSPSGSYAYKDADGNVYAAWFGLSY